MNKVDGRSWLTGLSPLDRAQAKVWLRSPGGEARLRRILCAIDKRQAGRPEDDKSAYLDQAIRLWLTSPKMRFQTAAKIVSKSAPEYVEVSFVKRLNDKRRELQDSDLLAIVERLLKTGLLPISELRTDFPPDIPAVLAARLRIVTEFARQASRADRTKRSLTEQRGLPSRRWLERLSSDQKSTELRGAPSLEQQRLSAFFKAFEDIIPDDLYVHDGMVLYQETRELLLEAVAEMRGRKLTY